MDLVPPSTPKGIIAFCNIFPALVAKVGWPYILKGRIRYAKRLTGCCAVSVSGMIVSFLFLHISHIGQHGHSKTSVAQVVALFDSLLMRLLGICLASFSSGAFASLTIIIAFRDIRLTMIFIEVWEN